MIKSSTARAPSAIDYTDEQQRSIEAEGNTVLLKALAGTGKTSTLVGFSEARPRSRILYLTFNASMRDAALSRFPSNVKVMTTHGPAFRDVGRHYADAGKLAPNLRPFEIARALSLKEAGEVPNNMVQLYALRIKETIDNFVASTQPAIAREHVSINHNALGEVRFFDPDKMVQSAQRCWDIMVNLNNKGLGMTHDGYLKLFHANGFSLGRYDYVLLDEAQDSNPAALDIVLRHQGRKMLVGDSNQAIYGFRGAIDAMSMVKADQVFPLQSSFRFGNEFADLANHLLVLNESDIMLRGAGRAGEFVGYDAKPPRGVVHISRGNGYIFEKAFEALQRGSKIGFLGGIKGYRFETLEDVYRMSVGDHVNDPFIQSFDCLESLKQYAEVAEDHDLTRAVKLTEEYGTRIPAMIEKIRTGSTDDIKSADVVFTTAHKSKGAEFDNVIIGDDYRSYPLKASNSGKDNTLKEMIEQVKAGYPGREEANIAYVALTRAMKTLAIPEQFEELRKIPNIQSVIAERRLEESIARDVAANPQVAPLEAPAPRGVVRPNRRF